MLKKRYAREMKNETSRATTQLISPNDHGWSSSNIVSIGYDVSTLQQFGPPMWPCSWS